MKHEHTRRRATTVALMTLLAGVPAFAGSIDLGEAGDFALFAMDGATLQINSMTLLEGDLGLGQYVDGLDNKKATHVGTVYQHSTSTATFNDKNYDVSGGIVRGGDEIDAWLEQATLDALAASSYYASLGGSSLGDLTSSIDLTGVGGDNVYTIDSLDFNAQTMVLHGTSSDMFVFNVLGDFVFAQSQILLDGIDPGQVLFNFAGVGSEILMYKAENVINGTFLVADRDLEYHNPATFNGRIIAGGTISLHSDANLVYNGELVPLPAAGWMGLSALGGLGVLGRVRRRGRRAA